MKSRRAVRVGSLFVLVATISGYASGQTLKKVAAIDLPGPKGQRFDYLTMDDEDGYLLSAHLGPGILYVVDVRTNKLIKAIPGVPGITGLEYVPGLRKVYTSDWGEEKIGVIDLRKMSVIKRLPTGRQTEWKHLCGALPKSLCLGYARESGSGHRCR